MSRSRGTAPAALRMARRLRAQTRPGFGASQLGQPLIMWLLLAVLILLILGLAYGLYTRKGSGINKHPGPDSSDPIVGDETKAEARTRRISKPASIKPRAPSWTSAERSEAKARLTTAFSSPREVASVRLTSSYPATASGRPHERIALHDSATLRTPPLAR